MKNCKILFRGSMSEPFSKTSKISDEFEYSNIWRKKTTLKSYLYLYLCYFQNMNIFGYLFGKYVTSEYIQIFVRYIMWHQNEFRYSFLSILLYSLITATKNITKTTTSYLLI